MKVFVDRWEQERWLRIAEEKRFDGSVELEVSEEVVERWVGAWMAMLALQDEIEAEMKNRGMIT